MTFEEWIGNDVNYLSSREARIAREAWEAGQKSVLDCAYQVSLAAPKGYVLVPGEPTEAMQNVLIHYPSSSPVEVYKAMIQATQEEE